MWTTSHTIAAAGLCLTVIGLLLAQVISTVKYSVAQLRRTDALEKRVESMGTEKVSGIDCASHHARDEAHVAKIATDLAAATAATAKDLSDATGRIADRLRTDIEEHARASELTTKEFRDSLVKRADQNAEGIRLMQLAQVEQKVLLGIVYQSVKSVREGGVTPANPHPKNPFPEWPVDAETAPDPLDQEA